jgi:hypothetical protein
MIRGQILNLNFKQCFEQFVLNLLFAGSEYFLSVEPVVVEGEEDLLNVAHEKRSCFFQVF